MKKICCVLLTLLLVFCCASALAEQCKYYYEDSPCEVKWWVDTQKQMHARACFNHVEEKEDMDSHVLVTDWENCTLDEGGQCTVCGWDYVREPEPDDYDEYWAMGYEYYYEWYGVPPLEITENNGKLTIAFKDDFFTFMDENGIPYTESAMVATEVTLAEVGGVLNVEVSEYGPGRWLMRAGMMSVEGPNGGVVEVTVEGKTYTLGSAAGVDLDHCQYYKEDSPCRPKWWVDKKNQQHARACFYHVEEKEDMSSHVLITPWEDCTLDAESVCTVCGYDYDPDLTQEDYDIMLLESFYAASNGGDDWQITASEDGNRLTVAFTDEVFAFMDQFERPYTESSTKPSEITLERIGGAWQVTVSEDGPAPWFQRMNMGWLVIGSIADEGDSASVEITVCGETYTLSAGGVDLEHCENYTPGGSPCETGYVGSLTDEQHAYVCFSHGATENDYVLITAWTSCIVGEEDVCIICGNDFGKFEEEEEAYEQSLVEAYYAYVDRMGIAPVHGVVSGDTLTVSLTIDYFALLDERGIVYTEHLQAETLYTLVETNGTWQVQSSGYGPGLWLEEYNLLSTHVIPQEDGTTTAYIAADCGEGYTLPEVVAPDPDCYHEAKCTAPDTCLKCGGEGLTLPEGRIQHGEAWFVTMGKTHRGLCEYCDKVLIEEPHTVWCGAQDHCTLCYEEITADMEVQLQHGSPDEGFVGFENAGDQCLYVCGCGERFYYDHQVPCTGGTTCRRCYGEVDRSKAELDHDGIYGEINACDDKYHYYYCHSCEQGVPFDHQFGDQDACAVCGYEKPAAPVLPEGALGSCTLQRDFPLWCDECDTSVRPHEAEAYYSKTHHWWVCAACGENNYDLHSANCNTADTCLVCQASGIQAEGLQHQPNFDNPVYDHDEYAHWDVCELCGASVIASVYQPHYALCTAPDTCAECGAKDVYFDAVAHVSERKYQHDETHHWYACDGCGETEKQLHSGFCFQPDECDTCMAEGVTVGVFLHDLSGYTSVGPTQCAQSCINCDYVSGWIAGHRASYCNAPDTCIFCGESGIVSEYVDHVEDDLQWRHDENGHWQACSACAGTHSVEAHRIDCAEPGVCIDCDATGVDGEICHADLDDFGIFQYDQDYHWEACDVCGEPMYKERHRMEFCSTTTKCDFCQYEGVNVIFGQHSYHGPSQGEYEETEGFYFFDENGHWLHCGRCGDETPQPHVFDSENVCRFCGYEKPVLPAEYCKYYSPDSLCEPGWWLDRDNKRHARACFYHVEDKENVNSHVLITPWEDCTLDEDGVCTVCGHDYTPTQGPSDDLSQEDCDAYMTEIYYRLLDKKGVPPMDVTLDGDTLTIKVNEQFQMMMLEMGIPVTETLLAGTTYTLKQVDGAWTVEATEYGPGAWLARKGLIAIGDAVVSGGKAEAEIALDGGEGYVLTAGAESPVLLPGDASGDGQTDIFDALAILQYAVGWDVEVNADAGDVDDDGKCDIFDALLILQYSVGWDVELK